MSVDIADILVRVLDDLYTATDRIERLEIRVSSREAELQRATARIDELVDQRDKLSNLLNQASLDAFPPATDRAIPPAERKA